MASVTSCRARTAASWASMSVAVTSMNGAVWASRTTARVAGVSCARTWSRTASALAKNSPDSTRRTRTAGSGVRSGWRSRSSQAPGSVPAGQPGDVRPRGPVEQQDQRDGDADEQAGQGVEDEDAEQGGERGEEVRAGRPAVDAGELRRPDPVEAAQRRDVDQFDDGRDDDRGEGGLRQLLEQPGQEQQGDDGQHGHRQPGELAPRAGAAVDRGLGQAAVDHHPAGQPGAQVGRAEAEQLPVRGRCRSRPSPRRSSPRPGPRRSRRAGRRPPRRPGSGSRWPPASGRPSCGQAGVDRADDRHALGVEVEQGHRGDAEEHRHQRAGHQRQPAAQQEDQQQARRRRRRASPRRCRRGGRPASPAARRSRPDALRHAEELRQLPGDDRQREADDEALEDRRGDEGREEAQPGEPRAEAEQAGDQRQRGGQADVVAAARGREVADDPADSAAVADMDATTRCRDEPSSA